MARIAVLGFRRAANRSATLRTAEANSIVALPISTTTPEPAQYRLAPHRIRRCTFRRLIQVEARNERIYDVECLYPDRKVPIPIGDLETAMGVCNACTAGHIFRPDEE